MESETGIKLLVDVESDPDQPIHPFTIPAGIYGQLIRDASDPKHNKYYLQFTLPTTSIYGYNWVYATVKKDTFESADIELADKNQDIPTINIADC